MKTVVLIEDDRHVSMLLSFLLEELPVRLEKYENGGEALSRLLCLSQPDLVILDLMLPTISGFEVLERLNNDPSRWQVPILVLSACAREKDRARAMQKGATAFLPKPFDFREFKAVVESMLRQPASVTPPDTAPGACSPTRLRIGAEQEQIKPTNGYGAQARTADRH